MKNRPTLLAMLFLAMVAVARVGYAEGNSVAIMLTGAEGDAAGMSAVSFGLSLLHYFTQHEDPDSFQEGPYSPTPEALHAALTSQTQIWRELRDKGEHPYDYLDQLALVDDQGYLREYVWHFHRNEAWGAPPPTLDLRDFTAWSQKTIPEHEPRLEAKLMITTQ